MRQNTALSSEVTPAISASSALLHLNASDNYSVPDVSKLMPIGVQGHRVYNFEVEGTHTYIADGIRVHNMSVLSLLSSEELRGVDWSTLQNTDSSVPGFDYVETEYTNEHGNLAGVTVYKTESQNGQVTGTSFTTTADEDGRLYQLQRTYDANGNLIGDPRPIYLTGQQAGEAVGTALTPFLTAAVIGDDASVFDRYAADTILGTFLENTLEFGGAFLHDQIVSLGQQNNSLNSIAQQTFGDLQAELVGNAVENAQGLLNQWIMAEIFGDGFSDGLAGQFAEGLANQVLDYGTTFVLGEVVDLAGLNASDLGLTLPELNSNFVASSVGALAAGIIIREVLPDLETEEGQIASVLASAAISAFATGPAAPVAIAAALGGFLVGSIFDIFFDKDPRAWHNTSFNENTGQFELGSPMSRDGGNTEFATSIADVYLALINQETSQFRSSINNFDEIGNHVVGYRESTFYGVTEDGSQTRYSSNDDAIKSLFLNDMANVDFSDGALIFKRAIDAVNIAERIETPYTELVGEFTGGEGGGDRPERIDHPGNLSELFNELNSNLIIASDYLKYLENKSAIDLTLRAEPESNFAAGWAATFLAAEQLGLTQSINVYGLSSNAGAVYTSSGDDSILTGSGSDEIHSFAGDDTIYALQGNDEVFAGSGNDDVFGDAGRDTLYGGGGADFLDGGGGNDILIGGAGNDGLLGSGGADNFRFAGLVGHDEIHDFEVGRDTISLDDHGGDQKTVHVFDDGNDAVLYFGENSTVRVEGVSASQLTINSNFFNHHSWNVQFSQPDNGASEPVVQTPTPPADSETTHTGTNTTVDINDDIPGTSENDIIRTLHGSDSIYAGLGDDFIDAGAGDDWNIFGDAQSFGDGQSGGSDIFYFAAGNGIDQIRDFENGRDKIQLGEGLSFEHTRKTQSGDTAIIEFTQGAQSGDRIMLVGINVNQINADDFVSNSGGSQGSSGGTSQPATTIPGGTNSGETLTGSNGDNVIRSLGDALSFGDGQSGGSDIFYFAAGNRIDQIRDFEDGRDKIQLGEGLSFEHSRKTQSGDTTIIEFTQGTQSGDRIMLVGINANQINADDFVSGSGGSQGSSGGTSQPATTVPGGTNSGETLTGSNGDNVIRSLGAAQEMIGISLGMH